MGAVTWGNGIGGTVGEVSAANSLVGSSRAMVTEHGSLTDLSNGNYVVSSPHLGCPYHLWLIINAGAVTWGNGKAVDMRWCRE